MFISLNQLKEYLAEDMRYKIQDTRYSLNEFLRKNRFFYLKNSLNIEDYIYYYNHGRYQERFHNLAPLEVREAALNTEYPQQYPIPENKKIAAYWASIEAKKSA